MSDQSLYTDKGKHKLLDLSKKLELINDELKVLSKKELYTNLYDSNAIGLIVYEVPYERTKYIEDNKLEETADAAKEALKLFFNPLITEQHEGKIFGYIERTGATNKDIWEELNHDLVAYDIGNEIHPGSVLPALKEVDDNFIEAVDAYYKAYVALESQKGKVVGIYKNNGEEGYLDTPANMIDMAFVSNLDLKSVNILGNLGIELATDTIVDALLKKFPGVSIGGISDKIPSNLQDDFQDVINSLIGIDSISNYTGEDVKEYYNKQRELLTDGIDKLYGSVNLTGMTNLEMKFIDAIASVNSLLNLVSFANPYLKVGSFVMSFMDELFSSIGEDMSEIKGVQQLERRLLLENMDLLGVSQFKGRNVEKTFDVSSNSNFDDVFGDSLVKNTILGNGEANLLQSLAGDDNYIKGNGGMDTLIGSKLKDTLEGGKHDDTYIYRLGYGHDTIVENVDSTIDYLEGVALDTKDKLILENVKSNQVSFDKNDKDLLIVIDDSNPENLGSIKVINYFNDDNTVNKFRLDKIKFEDTSLIDLEDIVISGSELGDTLKANRIISSYIWGGDGNDKIYGEDGDDKLYGGSDNDKIYGYKGDDILYGGTGNDHLVGGDGNDIYRFSRGFGNDEVRTNVYLDDEHYDGEAIEFLDINSTEVVLDADPNNAGALLIRIKDSNDSISILDYHYYNNAYVDTITFADEVIWDAEKIKLLAKEIQVNGTSSSETINGSHGGESIYAKQGNDIVWSNDGNDSVYGGSGNDKLYGGDHVDILYGNSDNDKLYGYEGDDILYGGTGNDYLEGGRGDDIYRFSKGFGNDSVRTNMYLNNDHYDGETIEFLDISSNEVYLGVDKNDPDNLMIKINGSDDSIRILDYFYYDNAYIDKITFSDGAVWTVEDIKFKAQELQVLGTESSETINGSDGNDVIYAKGGNDVVWSENGNDILYGGSGYDKLHGGAHVDVLYGDSGNDELYGKDGNDILYGGTGNDYLEGGRGDDIYRFSKGFGKDKIVTNNRYSNTDHYDGEVIEFLDISSKEVYLDVDQNDEDNLLIRVKGTNDSISLVNYHRYDSAYIDKITFSDGVVWDADDIKLLEEEIQVKGTENSERLNGSRSNEVIYGEGGNDTIRSNDGNDTVYGGSGHDSIYGGEHVDILYGNSGNDTIYGYDGNDILYGGTGNDYLEGGRGDDIYRFSKGFGKDKIVTNNRYSNTDHYDGEVIEFLDISSKEVYLGVDQNDEDNLLIRVKGTNDSISLVNYHRYDSAYIDKITFSDGVVWNADDIKLLEEEIQVKGTENSERLNGSRSNEVIYGEGGNDIIRSNDGNDTVYGGSGHDSIYGGEHVDILYGNSGNDTIYGYDGNDILYGGTGNDYLEGGRGDDIYRFSKGFGKDKIVTNNRYSNTDHYDGEVIEFLDISSKEVYLGVDQNDEDNLLIRVRGTNDSISLVNYHRYDSAYIDKITFSDGVVWNADDIKLLEEEIQVKGTENSERLNGSRSNEVIYGEGGNDAIRSNDGNDTVYGGSGHDSIYGGDHVDILYGNSDNDTIYGYDGNDILYGGTGNDYLEGGRGDDIYRFSKGFGKDKIVTNNRYSNTDHYDGEVIEFLDISSKEVYLDADQNDEDNLLIRVKGTNDSISLMNYYRYDSAYIDEITFADNVAWDANHISLLVQAMSEESSMSEGMATFSSLSNDNTEYAPISLGISS